MDRLPAEDDPQRIIEENVARNVAFVSYAGA